MIKFEITQADRDRVAEAEKTFELIAEEMIKLRAIGAVPNPNAMASRIPVRAVQMLQRQSREGFDDQTSVIILSIVEESNTMLPIAVESMDQAGIESALGGILADACLICSNLRLDFWTIAGEFSSDNLIQPDSDPLIALYKTVGVLASVAMHVELERNLDAIGAVAYKQKYGFALYKLCTAVHWLAFSNDLDIVSLLYRSFEASVEAINTLKEMAAPPVGDVEPSPSIEN